MTQLKNNMRNYFSNILKAKEGTILWTTYKDYKGKLKGAGNSNGFIACNVRATNNHSETYNLAYMLNRYLHPHIVNFFRQNDIVVDQDLYALSELVQWIWRSRIRNRQPINIYIPSMRMRELLTDWLDGK